MPMYRWEVYSNGLLIHVRKCQVKEAKINKTYHFNTIIWKTKNSPEK